MIASAPIDWNKYTLERLKQFIEEPCAVCNKKIKEGNRIVTGLESNLNPRYELTTYRVEGFCSTKCLQIYNIKK